VKKARTAQRALALGGQSAGARRSHQALSGNTLAQAAGIDYFGRGKEAWLKLIVERALWSMYG